MTPKPVDPDDAWADEDRRERACIVSRIAAVMIGPFWDEWHRIAEGRWIDDLHVDVATRLLRDDVSTEALRGRLRDLRERGPCCTWRGRRGNPPCGEGAPYHVLATYDDRSWYVFMRCPEHRRTCSKDLTLVREILVQ